MAIGRPAATPRCAMPESLQHEALWRFVSFLAVLLVMASWEWLAPRRDRCLPWRLRWPHNLALAAIDALLIRLLFPASALGFAVLAETRGWGLMQVTQASAWPAILATVVGLDCVIYWQHRLFHALPWLWRVHRVHHADVDLDVSTGLRFHPVEILLSMLIKAAAILLLGAPAAGVLLFEILLNATAMFNHANARLPPAADRLLRLVIVTPDMHRVHHSVRREETDSNFGFNLPWWDRLFGSYRAQPADGHRAMQIGLPVFREPAEQRLDRLLLQPLRPARC